jgi:peptide/nickel transport system substrate-binding protein
MVRVHTRRLVAIAAAGVLAGSLASCARSDGVAHGRGSAVKDLVLKVATTDTVTSLDPAGGDDVGSRTLQANLYQTLLTMLPSRPTPVPDAADCQYDAPTVYTCSLKKGLTFANGHQLTSSDVKFSLDRLVRLRTPGSPAALFTSLASITTPDDLTVVFSLKRPDATLPYLLTTTATAIVDEQVYPATKLLTGRMAAGSGPYELTSYQAGKRAVLAKFAGYRGARAAQNDGVEVNMLKTSADLRRAMTDGKADLGVRGFSPADLDKLRADDKLQVVEADAAQIGYFAFQLKSMAARRPAVRRAVAQLIDRQAIAKRAYADRVTPLYSLVPAGIGGQVNAFRQEYEDPSRTAAAAILQDGTVTTPVTLTLGWTPTRFGSGARAEAQELKRQLEASGLFKVNLRSAEWPRYQQLVRSGAFDLYHAGWFPAFPDADDYLSPLVQGEAIAHNGYKSPTVTRLLQRESTSQNQIAREATLAELQMVLAHDAAVIPTWQGRSTVVAGTQVQNVADALNPLYIVSYSPLKE